MKFVLMFLLVLLTIQPVRAAEITAPAVPDKAADVMPERAESFGEGLWDLIQATVGLLRPDLKEAAAVCLGVMAGVMLLSIADALPGQMKQASDLAGSVAIGTMLLKSTNALIHLGTTTVTELSAYGKLLLPVMSAAMAAQGGVSSSTALYVGTTLFNSVLSSFISNLLVPLLYIYLALSVANSAVGEDRLKKLRDFIKWAMVWGLKIILYVFTGYMGITGVVSGTTDAATLKAAKLTISGMVPVVGGILSDASEAVLVSAGVIKNTTGIYGLLAILSICIGPFLRIGVHYLLLKGTAAVCGIYGSKRITGLVNDFSASMGLVLAMTGSVCLLFLISTVCFLGGIA